MNYVSSQKGKVQKETLAGSRSCENNIDMSTLFQKGPTSSFASSSKFFPILCQLVHTIESVKNGSVG